MLSQKSTNVALVSLAASAFGCVAPGKYTSLQPMQISYIQPSSTLEDIGAAGTVAYAADFRTRALHCRTSAAEFQFTKPGQYEFSLAAFEYNTIGNTIVRDAKPFYAKSFTVESGGSEILPFSGSSWPNVDGGIGTVKYHHDGKVDLVQFEF
jgi:hypothetical protein